MWSNDGEKANARFVPKLVQPHKLSYVGELGHQRITPTPTAVEIMETAQSLTQERDGTASSGQRFSDGAMDVVVARQLIG